MAFTELKLKQKKTYYCYVSQTMINSHFQGHEFEDVTQVGQTYLLDTQDQPSGRKRECLIWNQLKSFMRKGLLNVGVQCETCTSQIFIFLNKKNYY